MMRDNNDDDYNNVMAELNRPLLSSSSELDENMALELPGWPEEAAARLKLLVPEEYATDCVYCHLRLDAAQRLLYVVAVTAQEEEQVLDVIDVDDMIGADMKIELRDTTKDSQQSSTGAKPVTGRPSNEPATDTLTDRQGQATLTIYSYPRRDPANESWIRNWCGFRSKYPPPNPPSYERVSDPSKLKERVAHHRIFPLAPTEDLKEANLLLQGIRRLATGFPSERHFLVICSPVSGPRKDAPEIYERKVRPVLEQAGISSEMMVTTHAGHGRERMAAASGSSDGADKDVTTFDGLIVMGGDGLIYEVVNGIMDREDSEAALRKVKIGIVGCGTSNGLAASLAKHASEMDDIMTCLFMIAKSKTIQIDLSKHQTQNSTMYSFLSYEYAMVADIDIQSEVIRWMGSLRFDLWGVLSVLRMRRYRARFTYLPAEKVPKHKTQGVVLMPATVQEAIPETNKDWVTIEDDFLLFWPSMLSHAASRTHHCPNSLIQDGIFKVFMVRGNVSRFTMAMILLGLETGTHVSYEQCEFIDACAYRLDPITPGLSVLDGEVIESGPVQAKILPATLTVFCHKPST
eukprot:scaffold5108_cov172-Amphora_coffeaeformis.AAC.14